MDHLYTPWRMKYIRGETKAKQGEGCVFCDAPAQSDTDALIIARSTHVYAILNLYPYNNGHLMVVPYAHVQSQEALPVEALTDLMLTANRAMGALRKLYNPMAFNLGANIGAAAGAGIAAHYHFHIVPRWSGDANFMTVVGETRVIPDTLENTQRELHQVWQELYGEPRT
ncbi:MAG: HIT domain-containing protein [Chloroflexota bacterium]|nr:HIT domain-containing protein [Chloroflexota bacterium]